MTLTYSKREHKVDRTIPYLSLRILLIGLITIQLLQRIYMYQP